MADQKPPVEDEELLEAQEGQEQPTDPVEDEQEDQEEEQQSEEEEAEQPEPVEDKKPSRRESLRIQKLVSKLREKQQEPAPREEPQQKGLDYRTALDADDEVITQLEEDRKTYGSAQYDAGLKRAESMQFHTRLEIDAPRVAAKYPILDKESPDFHPAVASALNESYLSAVGFDPQTNMVQHANVRYADYVEGMMELANEIAGQKVAASTKNIARQAASTGLRPDGSSSKRLNLNKAPHEMTDEELDAVIAQAIPPKR